MVPPKVRVEGDQIQWCAEAHTSSPEPCAHLLPTVPSVTSHCKSHDGSIYIMETTNITNQSFLFWGIFPAELVYQHITDFTVLRTLASFWVREESSEGFE